MNNARLCTAAALAVLLAACAEMSPSSPGKRELIVVGTDEKAMFNDAGVIVFSGPGRDTVAIVDIGTDPLVMASICQALSVSRQWRSMRRRRWWTIRYACTLGMPW